MDDYVDIYKNTLFSIGIAATYSGMYEHAKIIHDAGFMVSPESGKVVLGILQNYTMQDHYEEALASIDDWEKKHESFAFLTWWKGVILKVHGREDEAMQLAYKVREQGRDDLADLLVRLRVVNR